jgi:hypothetical protein
VNFLGDGLEIQLKMNQLTKAPKPTATHCDKVKSVTIFFKKKKKKKKKGWKSEEERETCHFDRQTELLCKLSDFESINLCRLQLTLYFISAYRAVRNKPVISLNNADHHLENNKIT